MAGNFGKGGAPWWMWALIVIALVMAYNEQFGDKSAAPVAVGVESESVPVEIPFAPSWQYSSFIDEMSSKAGKSAIIQSENQVSFSFPYEGEQRASLQLRHHPRYGKDVIFFVEKGQVNSRYDGVSVLVRFDDGSAMRFNAVEPEDRDSKTIFIQGYSRFSERLKGASRVKIEVPFYKEGNRVFEFDASGFDDAWL